MPSPLRSGLVLPAIFLGALILSTACSDTDKPPPEDASSAELILTHGRVYTFAWGEPDRDGNPAADAPHGASGWLPDAEAIAVREGRIVAVGSAEEIGALTGPNTEVIDLSGATVIPGLVDSHTHVAGLGELESMVNLIGVENEEEAIARVLERAAITPPGEWIVGRGWDEGAWANRYPTWEKLTAAVPSHPVALDSLHGFAIWANRLALEKADIDRDTPDPDGGEILRDAAGNPTGVVLNRAGQFLNAAIPPPTLDQVRAYTLAGLERMARDGFTAVHEAGSGHRDMAALESLADANALPTRVYAMLSARDEELCREWLDRGPISGTEGRLAVRSVKAYYDGALGSRGARLLDDYADRPGHRGTSGDEYGFDEALVADMMRAGFQVGIHAIGDAGNRESLDFIAGVIEGTPEARNARHRIEHAQVLHPDDIERFAELGVIASMEPPHAVEDMPWAEARLGADRVRYAYAWRTLRQSGARLTLNSDLSGSDHNIFYGLHAAITRQNKAREPKAGWYPAERLSPEEAIRGYTGWSAYASHWEQHVGRIVPGQWADLTVLSIDPLVVGEEEPGALLDGEVLATVVGGEVVFRAPNFSGD